MILRAFSIGKRIKRRRAKLKKELKKIAVAKPRKKEVNHLKNAENASIFKKTPKKTILAENFTDLKKEKKTRLQKEVKPINLIKNELEKEVFKHPISFFIDKKKFCEHRKERRAEIMRKTGGKGLKIKNAKWSIFSKMIKCRKVA